MCWTRPARSLEAAPSPGPAWGRSANCTHALMTNLSLSPPSQSVPHPVAPPLPPFPLCCLSSPPISAPFCHRLWSGTCAGQSLVPYLADPRRSWPTWGCGRHSRTSQQTQGCRTPQEVHAILLPFLNPNVTGHHLQRPLSSSMLSMALPPRGADHQAPLLLHKVAAAASIYSSELGEGAAVPGRRMPPNPAADVGTRPPGLPSHCWAGTPKGGPVLVASAAEFTASVPVPSVSWLSNKNSSNLVDLGGRGVFAPAALAVRGPRPNRPRLALTSPILQSPPPS